MGLTQAHFWPAVNKKPTRLWPGYFLDPTRQNFFDPKRKNWKICGNYPKPEVAAWPMNLPLTGVAVAERSLAPDWELRSKVVGSSNFSTRDCKKTNRALKASVIAICSNHKLLWQDLLSRTNIHWVYTAQDYYCGHLLKMYQFIKWYYCFSFSLITKTWCI